jgi:hypothetical protein
MHPVKVIVEPVYKPVGEKLAAMRKTIRILGLKVYEKTSRPLRRAKDDCFELFGPI